MSAKPSLAEQLSTLAATQIAKRQRQAATNRADFPFAASFKDQLEAAGMSCKVLYAKEGDKEVGKPQPFDGTDVDKILRYHNLAARRAKRSKRP